MIRNKARKTFLLQSFLNNKSTITFTCQHQQQISFSCKCRALKCNFAALFSESSLSITITALCIGGQFKTGRAFDVQHLLTHMLNPTTPVPKRYRYAEEVKKKKQLKVLFKRVVRQVIINTQWLDEDNEDDPKSYPFTAHAGRNIALLVRTKRKSGMLTASDKSLLRTPHHLRSIPDRKRLCMLFAGLKCFSSIPPKLRARLVPYIKLLSINAGRMIIRELDEPHTVIFIVTGEIEMSKTKLRMSSNTVESEAKIMFGPGDCIGELEMTEDCPRIHTFITRSQCELLAIFGDDFDFTLKDYMKKTWLEKKKAFKALDYFNFLNEEQILNACKMSSLKQFKPLDTIYSQDKGTVTNVHFVLSGECVILQSLNMQVSKRNGKKVYKLIDAPIESNLSDDTNFDMEEKDRQSILNLISIDRDESAPEKKRYGKMTLREIELACSAEREASISNHLAKHRKTGQRQSSSSKHSRGRSSSSKNAQRQSSSSKHDDNYDYDYDDEDEFFGYENYEEEEFEQSRTNSNSISSGLFDMRSRKNIVDESNMDALAEWESSEEESSDSGLRPSELRFAPSVITETIESHFIDVGSMTFGAIFGLGEKIQDRVVMARNTVQCLMLPRFFLLDKDYNPGNIWQRRLFYLDCMIPTREMLFKDFLRNIEWKKFKTEYIDTTLKSIAGDVATIDDIPILCRIEAGISSDLKRNK